MSDAGHFNDFEPETDDHEAIEEYAAELKAAVEGFGVIVTEPGGDGPAPQDMPAEQAENSQDGPQ